MSTKKKSPFTIVHKYFSNRILNNNNTQIYELVWTLEISIYELHNEIGSNCFFFLHLFVRICDMVTFTIAIIGNFGKWLNFHIEFILIGLLVLLGAQFARFEFVGPHSIVEIFTDKIETDTK